MSAPDVMDAEVMPEPEPEVGSRSALRTCDLCHVLRYRDELALVDDLIICRGDAPLPIPCLANPAADVARNHGSVSSRQHDVPRPL